MRTIPKASKVKLTFYKGITVADVVIALIALAIIAVTLSSNFSFKWYLAGTILVLVIPLYLSFGSDRLYVRVAYMFRYLFSKKGYSERNADSLIPYRSVSDGLVLSKDGSVFSAIEIEPVNFSLLDGEKQNGIIDCCYARVLGSIEPGCQWVLLKKEMPLVLDEELQEELRRADRLREMRDSGELTQAEFLPRCDSIQSRFDEIDAMNTQGIDRPRYFLCLTGISGKVVKDTLDRAIATFESYGIEAHRLDEKGLLCLVNHDRNREKETDGIVLPEKLKFGFLSAKEDGRYVSFLAVNRYPLSVPNGWAAELFSMENTEVTMRMDPVEKQKAIRRIDNAILELGTLTVGKESQQQETELQADTLKELLQDIQQNNETLFDTEIVIAVYDADKRCPNRKKAKAKLSELGFGYTELIGRQMDGYVSALVSLTDMLKMGHGIQTSSLAASFPFDMDVRMDRKGILLGESSLPVFFDPFRRDLSHINSNMVVIGQSGSGKSFATKKTLLNLASLGSKVYVLDPESEYGTLAERLGGVRLDASDGSYGRINPLQIMTTMDDEGGSSNSFYAHLQFLEQFFRLILKGISQDALESVNRAIEECYAEKNIGPLSNLNALKAEDYPTLEDLCLLIEKKLSKAKDEYELSCLRSASNWMTRFKNGYRDSSLWNGCTTFSPKENFIDFDFQRLLSNHNDVTANAQMLLLLRWLENEVIRNRDYNRCNGSDRKIVIAIDEAHLFIDEKYPVALDFMHQMAKRIRKYDGMLLIITQNVKDFSGTPEIAKKSSAIINVSQYSMIFSLSPDDMKDLNKLYEAGGGFNPSEKETIIHSPRGTCFFIGSPEERNVISIEANGFERSLFEG